MTVEVRALLDAPHWPDDPGLDAILGSLLRRRPMELPATPPDPAALWPASSFGLDRVTSFRESLRQEEILRRCAADRLAEALYVEKLGLAFCAKMTLLAETAEERMLYALTAADEATHFYWMSSFVEDRQSCLSSSRTDKIVCPPLLALVQEWIEQGSRSVLTLLIQVVLEGWGVQHYRLLGRDCRDPQLARILREIVTDEARHHGSGTRLFTQRALSEADRQEIVSGLRQLLDLVRCGPQAVVAAIGPRVSEARRCFEELDAEEDSRRKLALLRDLISDPALAAPLDFTPMTAEECARYAFATRAPAPSPRRSRRPRRR